VTTRPRYFGFLAGAVLVAFYGWLAAVLVEHITGSAKRGHVGVTAQHFLVGVLVVYAGGLLWSAGCAGAMLVVARRCGRSADFRIGRGPRLVRLTIGGSRLEWLLWPWWFSYDPDADLRSIPVAREIGLVRAGLWSGVVVGAVVALVSLALPGRSWVLATAALPALLAFVGLASSKSASMAGQLRLLKQYPAAAQLRDQARAAAVNGDNDKVLAFTDQALAQPHNETLAWQMQMLAAVAITREGRFLDAVPRWEAVLAASPNGRLSALIRANIADVKFTEVLRTGVPLSDDEFDQMRAWAEESPAGSSPQAMAGLHRKAMLRLLEGHPDEAISVCSPAFEWYQAQPDPRSRAEWQVTAATLVIAYARAGQETKARAMLSDLSPAGVLYDAAVRELAPSA
jgi:hypothetical protein